VVAYRDRADAGRRLAEALEAYRDGPTVVLGLPRGGVVVAAPVAEALGAALGVLVVRKLGTPRREELAMGAVAEGGVRVLNPDVIDGLAISPDAVDAVTERELAEVGRRVHRYRGGRPLPELKDRTVVIVDDGLATGMTAEAALRSVAAHGPRRLILAVPVCAPSSREAMTPFADEVVCPLEPPAFGAVGTWYDDFHQVTDDEVLECLRTASGDCQE
jgi:putative phosphoribosyl transferase